MRPGCTTAAAVSAVVAALLAIALIAAGGLLAAGKIGGGLALMVHRVAPVLIVVATAVLLYVLARGR